METLETALTTLVAALIGTLVGGLITYKATAKVEENRKIHDARIAEVQLWTELRRLTLEGFEAASRKALEQEKGNGTKQELMVKEIMRFRLLLQNRLDVASYEAYEERSAHHLKRTLKGFENDTKGIDAGPEGEMSPSEKIDKFLNAFVKLLRELEMGHQFSREMLQQGQSNVLPDPNHGMYT